MSLAFTKRSLLAYALTLSAVIGCSLPFIGRVYAAAGINPQINFQGRLLNNQGATVPDGYYNIEFKIYQDGDGQSAGDTTGSPAGSLKWTEDYLNSNSQAVTVKNGFLSVQLGSINPFGSQVNWNSDTLWLSVNIGGTGSCASFSACSPDGEMVPMKRLSANPYALNAGMLGGLTAAQFLQIGQGVQTDATSASSLFLNKTGSGSLIELQSSGTDVFTVGSAGDLLFGNNANHALSVATAGANVAGKSLTISSGAAGSGSSALAGGNLALQGGAGGGTNGNGGNVTIDAGAKNGTGTNGTIGIGTTTASTITLGNSAGTINLAGTTTVIAASNTTTTVQGNGIDIIDFNNSAGSQVASIDLSGNVTAKSANFSSSTSGGTTVTSLASNQNTNATVKLMNAYSTTLATGNKANSNTCAAGIGGACNIDNGLNLNSVTAVTGNAYNGIYLGSNYTNGIYAVDTTTGSLLNVAGTSIISGAGVLQNTGLSSSVNYTNLTQVGALVNGSIASGFGAISTGNNIVTSAMLQGGTIQNNGGSFAVNSSGNVTVALSGTSGTTLVCHNGTQLSSCTNTYESTTDTTTFIRNQTGPQTGNFNITGIGSASTSFATPLVDSISGVLNVGTTTATGVTIGGTTNTAALLLQGVAAATYTIGTASNTGGITLGNSTATNIIAIGNATTTATQTINIGGGATGAGKDSVTIGSANGTSATTIQAGANGSTTTLALQAASGGVIGLASNAVAQTVNIGNTTGASAVSIASGTGNITIGNTTGTVAQIINIGTNTTASSSTSLNIGSTIAGATTLQSAGGITVSKSLTAGSAAGTGTFTNNGSTVNSVLAISNSTGVFGTGTAAGTVDIYTAFSINAGASGLTYTPPSPTANTTYGRIIYVSNTGSNIFTLGAYTLSPGGTATLVWSNTSGGASWQFAGADGSSILNQSATTQPGTFKISGSGTSTTSFLAPLVDSASGTLGIGSSTATGVTIGGTANTTSLVLQGAASATYTIGTSNNTGGITLGNSTAANTIAIGNAATTAAQTIAIGTGATGAGTDVITIGSANGTSATTIQAGANGTATTLALQTASGGVVGIASNAVAQTVNIGNTTGASAVNIASGTGNITIGNAIGTVAQTINIGTNATASSSTTLNIGSTIAGATTLQSAGGVTVSKSFTSGASAGSGTFTNNGSTVDTVLAIANSTGVFGTGTAAGTVDIYTAFSISGGTTGLTYTPPTPTASTTYGRVIYVSNVGSNIFTLGAYTLGPGGTATLIWSNTTGGASWQFAGSDGSSILNQSAVSQPATFNISGTGTAANFKVTPGTGVVDTSTAGQLNIGTSAATSIVIGGSTSAANTIQAYNGTAVQSTNDSSSAFSVQNSVGASMLSVDTTSTAASSTANLAVNGGSESAYGSEWTALSSSTVSRDTTTGEFISGKAALKDAVTAANSGAKNNLGAALAVSSNFTVSFSAEASVASTSSDLSVTYYRTTGTLDSTCTTNLNATKLTATWVKYTCNFTTTATAGTTSAFIAISQTSATSRNIFIDSLSVVQQNTTATQNTGVVRIGGAAGQSLTLFQLDTSAGTPFTGANQALAGAMYFDTTQGKMQCYDGSVWGACGAAPTSLITLTPEYTGAVLHGTSSGSDNNIGTMTSDFCSNSLGINDGSSSQPTICVSSQTYNFYKWTSPQSNAQTYSIYVTYQLPSSFKGFVSGQTSLVARTDSSNATVAYTVYKNVSGSLSTCAASTTVSTGSQSNWQTVAPSTDPASCGFSAGNSIVFKITVTSSSSANAYVSNLNFQYNNQ